MSGKMESSEKITIEAFSKPPDLKEDENPMLFDHALLQHNDENIKFAVGNLMALSAPGKGMKKTDAAVKIGEQVEVHGKPLTKEYIKIVRRILDETDITDDEDKNNDAIKNIYDNWYKKMKDLLGEKEVKKLKAEAKGEAGAKSEEEIEKEIEKVVIKKGGEKFKKELIDAMDAKQGDKSFLDRVIEKLLPECKTDCAKEKIRAKINASESYYILQALGSNEIWDAQNLGGFLLPETTPDAETDTSPYNSLKQQKLGKSKEVTSKLVEKYVLDSIPENGILFLCESAVLFKDEDTNVIKYYKKSGKPYKRDVDFNEEDEKKVSINHLPVYKDQEKYEKVYSATWMRDDINVEVIDIKLS